MRVYRQSVFQFGATHAGEYLAGLETAVRSLLAFPESAPLLRELKGNVRIMRYRSHYVLYRIEGDDLVLVRILHVRQDVSRYLKS